MTALREIARFGTATLYERVPDFPPSIVALCAISLGAQNFDAHRRSVASRRDKSGVRETYVGDMSVRLEAYAPTREQLDETLDAYKAMYAGNYQTRFFGALCVDGEFVAYGRRYAEEGWAI